MSLLIVVLLFVVIMGGGGGYYAHGRYGVPGLVGVIVSTVVIIFAMWVFGGLIGLSLAE